MGGGRRKEKTYQRGHRGGTEITEKGQEEKEKDLTQRTQRGAENAEKGGLGTLGSESFAVCGRRNARGGERNGRRAGCSLAAQWRFGGVK